MTLTSRLTATLLADLLDATPTNDLASLAVPREVVVNRPYDIQLATGTGAGQADKVFTDTRTVGISTNDDLDLAGVLTDAFGATITFARIKGLLIAAAAGNTNNLVVGAAAANPVSTLLNTTGTIQVRPGGFLFVAATDLTGYVITAGTADILRIANGAGSTSTYDIGIIGCSA